MITNETIEKMLKDTSDKFGLEIEPEMRKALALALQEHPEIKKIQNEITKQIAILGEAKIKVEMIRDKIKLKAVKE